MVCEYIINYTNLRADISESCQWPIVIFIIVTRTGICQCTIKTVIYESMVKYDGHTVL